MSNFCDICRREKDERCEKCVFNKPNSYDIIADKVREFWKKNGSDDVIAFFYQKYDHEKYWEWHEELCMSQSDSDYETVEFLNDFCEGQTDVKDVTIVSLSDVTAHYTRSFLSDQEDV